MTALDFVLRECHGKQSVTVAELIALVERWKKQKQKEIDMLLFGEVKR